MNIAVLHGPNLNLLGVREPERYGRTTLSEIDARLVVLGAELEVGVSCAQYNGEGALIDAVHTLRGHVDGVVINAGAYTHTSLAIRDALVGVSLPYVEVHLTNIYAREPERRRSMLAAKAVAVCCGFGAFGYELALRGLVDHLRPAVAHG